MSKQRNSTRRPRSPVSPVLLMVDSKAALEASQRLYEKSRSGLRFSCEHREVMSAEEALARDRQEARRKGKRAARDDAGGDAGDGAEPRQAHTDDDPPSAWLGRPERTLEVDDDLDEFDADDIETLDLSAYDDDLFDEAEAEADGLVEFEALETA
ncbi:MAG: hypothetical protein R3E68_11555 [Burkholderiaceae bacterium]